MVSVETGRRRPASRGRVRWLINFIYLLILAMIVLPLAAILTYRFVPPVSTLMLGRWLTGEAASRTFAPLAAISPNLLRAVIAAEDSRFCRHAGVDWIALRDVLDEADEGGPSRGASTIAMQTAKNVFLWPGRSYIRKGLEIPLALAIDVVWGKQRVMEAYLNVAEWGDGVFGAEAAAQKYFHKSAKTLTAREAALLAAVLPNPIRFDAGRPSAYVARRAAILMTRAINEDLSCLER
jgi:monofunctional biosynthetic peptidoglycan transglycosylase